MSLDANNPLVTNFITRAEYEARHAELQIQIGKFDSKLDNLANKLDTYNAAINARIDKSVQDFNTAMETEKDRRMLVRIKVWKFVVLNIASVIVGGSAYAFGSFLVSHHF